MNIKILFYKIFFKLYKLGVSSINIEELHSIYEELRYTINDYNDKNLSKLFNDENNFIKEFVFLFTYFELGLFINDELIFDNPIFIPHIIDSYPKESVAAINLSHYMYHLFLQNRTLKKVTKI